MTKQPLLDGNEFNITYFERGKYAKTSKTKETRR